MERRELREAKVSDIDEATIGPGQVHADLAACSEAELSYRQHDTTGIEHTVVSYRR
jgi:hypothetical protein